MLDLIVDFVALFGNDADWFHHWRDERVNKINQNEVSAISQFIGDKWGIIKSPTGY